MAASPAVRGVIAYEVEALLTRLDRITDPATIIENGTEFYRFRRTLEKRRGKAPDAKGCDCRHRRSGGKNICINDAQIEGSNTKGGPNSNIKRGHAALSKSSRVRTGSAAWVPQHGFRSMGKFVSI